MFGRYLMTKKKKTNWGGIAAWLGLGLTFLGTIYTIKEYYKDKCPQCGQKMVVVIVNSNNYYHCSSCDLYYDRIRSEHYQ